MKNKCLTSATGITVLVLLCLLLSLPEMKAQWLSETTIDTTTLDEEQLDRFNNIKAMPFITETRFVNVSDLITSQQNGWLDLSAPGNECTLTLKTKYVKLGDSTDFYWFGETLDQPETEDCDCQDGFANIMSRGGRIFGSFVIDEDEYQLHDIGGGKNVLTKRDYGTATVTCANTGNFTGGDSENSHNGNDESAGMRNLTNCNVTVLGLFTPNAAAEAGTGVEDLFHLFVDQTNQALKRSDIDHGELHLQLVGTAEIDYTETPDFRFDRDSLIGNPDLQHLRDSFNADIVIVYVRNPQYPAFSVGIVGTLDMNPDSAVALIRSPWAANASYADSHETAHIFSCRHEFNADPRGIHEHAHRVEYCGGPLNIFKKKRHTIVWSDATRPTIPYFSNPEVNYRSRPTGVPHHADNAKQLRNNACTVAEFRQDNISPGFFVSIRKPHFACPCINRTLHADINGGGTGTYQIEWRRSTDGFNFGLVESTTSFFNITMPCTIGDGFFVKLTVTDTNGNTKEVTEFIESAFTWPNQQAPCDEQIVIPDDYLYQTDERHKLNVELMPNPTTGNTLIHFKELENESIELYLTDRLGNVQLIWEFELGLKETIAEIDVTELPKGLYFLKICNGAKTVTKKLFRF